MAISKAHSNIAVLKYWGKTDEELIIPTKSSLSFTLSSLWTETEVTAEKGEGFDLTLNNRKATEKENERIHTFLAKLANYYPEVKEHHFTIISKNNFPTAAGMASSASGFAALVKALFKELNISLTDDELSKFARLGSGSACRSIHGGVVLWHKGTDHDSSYAEQLFPADHWPDLRIVYVLNNEAEKKIRSREAMRLSVETSPFYGFWTAYEESQLLPDLKEAIKYKDFDFFGHLTMEASDNMHAVCLSTKPSIAYLSDKSRDIVELVNSLNTDGTKVAYTFDAGPNPALFTLEEHLDDVLSSLNTKTIVSSVV